MDLLHLALDTSTSRPAVALMRGETPLHDWVGPGDLRHHETLLLGVDECLKRADFQLRDLAFLSVGVGPGLFTGLRIGIATAKFVADPLRLPCVAVSSLLALGLQSEEENVWAVSDAKARRVYAMHLQRKELAPDLASPAGEEFALSPEEAAGKVRAGDLLIGEGALLYREAWPAEVRLAPADAHLLKASSIGKIGARRYALGLCCDANDLQPTYLKTGNAPL